MTSSGIHVLVLSHCCFAAVTFLRMTASFHASQCSYPPHRNAICDYIFSTCHFLLYIFHTNATQVCSLIPLIFFWFEAYHAPTLVLTVQNGCVRNQPAWIDMKKNVQKFYPPFFIPFFSFTFSDRHSYYYKPPTVLVKFFAYPVASFYTYRV